MQTVDNEHEKLIEQWLKQRQALLSCYWSLSELPPFDDISRQRDLAQFLELLIDYTSYGHFHIYAQLLDKMAPEDNAITINTCYHHIQETTDIILACHDGLEARNFKLNRSQRKHVLSLLGEAIADRLSQEDRLLARLA